MKQGTVEQAKPGRARGQTEEKDENSPGHEVQNSAETQRLGRDIVMGGRLGRDTAETWPRHGLRSR